MTQQQSCALTTSSRSFATPARSRLYCCRLNARSSARTSPRATSENIWKGKKTKDSLSLVSLWSEAAQHPPFVWCSRRVEGLQSRLETLASVLRPRQQVLTLANAEGESGECLLVNEPCGRWPCRNPASSNVTKCVCVSSSGMRLLKCLKIRTVTPGIVSSESSVS